MKRTPCFNPKRPPGALCAAFATGWLLLLALAATAAQRPDNPGVTAINVSAPTNYVVAARTLQFSARAVNSRGAILRGRTFQWQVSDPSRASIDGNGLLTGLAPGAVSVTGTDGDSGVSGAATILIYPSSVSITSTTATVQTGDNVKLAAQAKDANGNTIPGVPFQWFSDLPSVAAIAADGTLTGVGEGKATVTAGLDMGPAFSRFVAFANITVTRHADFTLKGLISSAAATNGTVATAPVRVSAAGNFVAAISGLSNGGQALLLWDGARLRTLGTAGSLLNGRTITFFDSMAVNARGDVVALANAPAEWCEQLLVLYTAASQWAPTILDDTTRCGYWALSQTALDKQDGIVYRTSNSLNYRKPDGSVVIILSLGDKPAGLAAITNISNWGAAPSGKILIEAQPASSFFNVYLAWDGTGLQKLFSAGDPICANSPQWATLPAEVAPGEYVTRAGNPSADCIARLKNGTWSTVAASGQNGFGWLQNPFSAADGYVFFYADSGSNRSLVRSDGSTLTTLATWPDWRDLNQIMAVGGDAAVVFGTMGGVLPHVTRFGGTSSTPVLASGQSVDGNSAPALAFSSLTKGVNPSLPVLRTYGDALLQFSGGATKTLLKPGDALPSGKLSSLAAVAANRLGDLAFTAIHGAKMALYAYRNGQIQTIADADDLMPGNSTIFGFENFPGGHIAMNNPGHVTAFTYSSSGYGLFLFTNTAATAVNVMRLNGSAAGGATFLNVNLVALDDNDRVAFVADLSNGKRGLFLWEKGSLRELLETGQPDPLGRTISDFFNLQAAGTRLYVRTNISVCCGSDVLALDGVSVKTVGTESFTTSSGIAVIGTVGGDLAANTRGDVVFPVRTPSGEALLVRRADGSDAIVAAASVRGPDGEWFLSLNSAGIGEQGDVVYSGLVSPPGAVPRLEIYQATPK